MLPQTDQPLVAEEHLAALLPFWPQLTLLQRQLLCQNTTRRKADAGSVIYSGASDCVGVLVLISGRLRAFMLSEEGREITLYRLFDRDICLFSASCMLKSIQFDLSVQVEQDASYFQISAKAFQRIMAESAAVANYTNELMASKFSDVMWLMDQILSKRLDSRIAAFLLEESDMAESPALSLTHDAIARHLGSAREVVTRMLKYFHAEGLVSLSRGRILLSNPAGLESLAQGSRKEM